MSVPYYGDFAEDDTVDMVFNAFTSDDPSASATISDFINTDVHIHKDLAVAQRNNAAGITVSVDYDGITGNHAVKIDTSDNTVAGFYVTGSEYQVRIEGTTVDGATINAWIGTFSIERAGGVIALLKLIQTAVITNAAGADVAADIIAVKAETAAIVTDTGTTLDTLIKDIPTVAEFEARSDLAGTAATPAEVATALTDIDLDHLVNAAVADEVANDSIIAKLVSKDATADWSDYSWQTESLEALKDGTLANIEADTNELQGDDYPTSIAAVQTTVDAIETAVITNAAGVDVAADIIAIKAETALIVGDTNELQTDNVPGLIATAQADLDTITGASGVVIQDGTIVAASLGADCITAAKIADNAIAAEHLAAGAIDNATFAADVGSTAHGTNIIALACRKILEELNLDHLLKVDTTVAADGDLEDYCVAGTVMAHLLAAGADATAYKASTDSLEAIKVHADTIKAETALIVADTNELQTDNIPATLATIAGYLDTEIAAIKGQTDLVTAARMGALTDWIDGGRLDLLLDAIKAKTDNQPAGIPKNVALSNFEFLMVLSADHITPATGKSLTEEISKDGAAFAACTNAAAEIGNGVYKINLTQTEMNADIITLKFTEAACDQRTITIKTSA